jgi:hypothetical protein
MSSMDEKQLRKAWLKRKFASWEYHEELLKLHDEYLSALHRHWGREDIQKAHPEDYKAMRSPVFLNFDRVEKPGQISKSEWNRKKTVGWADAISYNFNRGMDFSGVDQYTGMTQEERDHLNGLVAKMLQQCQNIKYQVDSDFVSRRSGTDEIILNEEVTGPITWPTNWRDDVADLAPNDAVPTSVPAGQPCPREGFWFTPAQTHSRRYFQQGEVMPSFPSAYGATVWQWDHKQ